MKFKRLKHKENGVYHIVSEFGSSWCGVENGTASEFLSFKDLPINAKECKSCQSFLVQIDGPIKQAYERELESHRAWVKTADFLFSYEWRKLRMEVIKHYGAICMCCRSETNPIHVDHIKPRKKRPDLALDFDNLQILCDECNHGKGNWDETDWRPKEEEYLPDGALQHLESMKRH